MKSTYKFWLITGCLFVSALVLIGMIYPDPLYSPGKVVKGHEGLRCRVCHVPFRGVSSASCSTQGCHPSSRIGKEASLRDLHRRVAGQDCLLCHTEHLGPMGNITKPFSHKGISETACTTCHQPPRDRLHIQAPEDCAGCHGVERWRPSTYDHSRYFLLDTAHNVSCSRCHDRGSYRAYTCLNCHEHSTRRIVNEHLEEGIYRFGDCLRCHRVYMDGRAYGRNRSGEGMGGEGGDDDYRYRYPEDRGYMYGEDFEYEDD